MKLVYLKNGMVLLALVAWTANASYAHNFNDSVFIGEEIIVASN